MCRRFHHHLPVLLCIHRQIAHRECLELNKNYICLLILGLQIHRLNYHRLSDEKKCKELGIPTEMEYLEMYEEKTGYQIKSEWNLYMGFNLFKLAAISQGIMGRVRDGTAAGKNADSFGENAVMMADEAWKLINE